MTALHIAAASWRRLLRDRTGLFFLLVLPIMVIALIGLTIRGSSDFRVGLVVQGDGPVTRDLVAALEAAPSIAVHRTSTEAAGRTSLRRSELDAVVVVPATLDAAVRAGRPVTIDVVAERTSTAQIGALTAVTSVVQHHANQLMAARFAADRAGGTLAQRLELVRRVEPGTTPVTVRARTVNAKSDILPAGFNYSAPTMLVLFVFINSVASGAAMIQTRGLGMYERMLAGPLHAHTIVAGETLCYLGLALLQSLLIVGLGALAFGVSWGSWPAAVVLIGLWALVGTGAGMLAGTTFRTPEQATAIGPPVGIALGMLGGCMWPLEIVGSTMRTIGHLTPHAWAVDAWATLVSKGGHLGDITQNLLVLAGFAAVLLVAASIRLRASLTT